MNISYKYGRARWGKEGQVTPEDQNLRIYDVAKVLASGLMQEAALPFQPDFGLEKCKKLATDATVKDWVIEAILEVRLMLSNFF